MHKRTYPTSARPAAPNLHHEPHADLADGASPAGARCRTKRCRACGLVKELNAFNRLRGRSNRYRTDCKRCRTARAAGGWRRRVNPIQEPADFKRCRRELCLRCQAAVETCRETMPIDLAMPDGTLPQHSEAYEQRIDLGIAIAHATCPPGHRRTLEKLAAYADVSKEAIRVIEEQALCKVRRRFVAVLQELGIPLDEVIIAGAHSSLLLPIALHEIGAPAKEVLP